MNPPSSPAPVTTPLLRQQSLQDLRAAAVPVATALLSTRPPFIVSLLRVLMSISGIIALLLGLSAYEQLLPEKYAVWMAIATGILAAAQKFILDVGDILDDGIKNGSFKPGGDNPSVLRQWYLFPLLLGSLALVSCNTMKMSQTQLSLADLGYSAAQGALIIAETTLAEKLADPKTPAWQVLSAKLAFSQARKTLDRERAKLDAAFANLLSGKVPADLAMPAYTSAKAAVPVWP